MYHNHWKRLLCLALVLTLLMSISAVLAAPYDAKNTENTYDQTGNQFSETASLPDSVTMIIIPMTDPSWRISMRKTTAGLTWIP